MTAVQADTPQAAAPNVAVGNHPRADRRFARYLALDDFEAAAKRHLPRMLYGFISGGAETNAARQANLDSYQDYAFIPRVLADVSRRSHGKMLFGRAYAAPFGIAPMGASAICAYRGDLVFAQAAAAANIPMILSAASLIRLEEVRAAGPTAWYQAYLPGDAFAHRAAGRSRRRRGLRGVRADRGRAGLGEPREQCAVRLQHSDQAFRQARLGRGHPSRLVARHVRAHRDAARHAAFREHGRDAWPSLHLAQSRARARQPRSDCRGST